MNGPWQAGVDNIMKKGAESEFCKLRNDVARLFYRRKIQRQILFVKDKRFHHNLQTQYNQLTCIHVNMQYSPIIKYDI